MLLFRPILISTILFYHVYMQAYVITAAEQTGNFHTNPPIGCKETTAGRNVTITCIQSPFDDIISAIPKYGGNLTSLYIHQCQPQVNGSLLTPASFAQNNNLTNLKISECKIAKIEPGTFQGLTKLRILTLTNTGITTIFNGTFQGLHLLSHLNLASSLEKVLSIENGAFSDLRNLNELYLGQTEGTLVASPYLLHGLINLAVLDLSGISVTHTEIPILGDISDFFKDQETSLQQLTLGNTDVSNQYLPFLKNLKGLNSLYLLGNHIGYIIKESLPTLRNGGFLSLANNDIMYIDASALSVYSKVDNVSITLSGNPFYCNCDLLGFSGWLREIKSSNPSIVTDMDIITCGGPVASFGKKVVDYNAYWWQCDQYVPLVALVFIVALAIFIAIIVLIVYCNWVSIRYWCLERRVTSEEDNERRALLRVDSETPNSSGKTGAYIIYNMEEQHIMQWTNQYLEDKLQNHKMKISLQWPAGPQFIPLWKQIKDHGFGVNHYLVIVTDDFIQNQWPEIYEKSGLKNIRKFVLVLMGKKRSELPKDLVRLGMPCFEWPETKTFLSSLKRERELFWKRVRIALKEHM